MLNENLELIDLTHELNSEVPNWHANYGYSQEITSDYDASSNETKFRNQQITMQAGIGTHMDSPAHCFPNAVTIDKIPLQQLIAPCIVIDVSNKAHETYRVSAEDIMEFENNYGEIPKNSFVMIYTGWDKYWDNPVKYRNELIFPSVAKDAAELLLKREVVGLGIDTLSPDTAESNFPIHQLFLGNGKYLIENVANAKKLPLIGAHVIALPIKITNGTESPVRIIALINRSSKL